MTRLIIAALAISGSSLIVFPLFLAPIHPVSLFDTAPLVWLSYAAGGLITGACLPQRWYVSIAIAWYPLSLIAAPYFNCTDPNLASIKYYCALTINMAWVSPVIALLSGFIGSRLMSAIVNRQRRPQRHWS